MEKSAFSYVTYPIQRMKTQCLSVARVRAHTTAADEQNENEQTTIKKQKQPTYMTIDTKRQSDKQTRQTAEYLVILLRL